MKSSWKTFCLVGAITFGILILLSPSTLAKEKTVVIGDSSTLKSLDPAFAGLAQDIINARNIYQGLVKYKVNSMEIEGDLAKSWTISKDGLVYRLNFMKMSHGIRGLENSLLKM